MKRERRGAAASLVGYLLFFLTVGACVAVAVLVYRAVETLDRGAVFGIMFAVVFGLAALLTAADAVRRRVMVDRPIERILELASRIAAGDFSARAATRHTYGSFDEYDVILDRLNRVAEELGKSEVLKSDFISNVSHELKTPLSVIRSYALALSEEDDPERFAEYKGVIVSATERLSSLVENILKLNKLENSALAVEKERVELGESVREAVLRFEERIAEKEIELACEIDDVAIVSAPSYLEIVWNNLISNAVKFTPQGGGIAVTVRAENGGALVQIADTGCGIAPEVGARIFEKFYQGDTSHAAEGNGLGLALVKRVIDVLGGEISVESRVGEGSIFSVRLKGE